MRSSWCCCSHTQRENGLSLRCIFARTLWCSGWLFSNLGERRTRYLWASLVERPFPQNADRKDKAQLNRISLHAGWLQHDPVHSRNSRRVSSIFVGQGELVGKRKYLAKILEILLTLQLSLRWKATEWIVKRGEGSYAVANYIMMSILLRRFRCNISTDIIKRDIERRLRNPNSKSALEYPRTFEQKVVLLNDPRTIQKL